MKNIIKFSLILGAALTFFIHASDALKGDAEAGQNKAAACFACHGVGGTGVNPEWPRLAGQRESYLYNQLLDFKSGKRKNFIMSGQVTALTNQDMADFAAYFSSVPAKYDVSNKDMRDKVDLSLLEHGEQLFRGGDVARGLTACVACHGPAGRGLGSATYPAISGQYSKYFSAQLKNYRSGAILSEPESTAKLDTSNYRLNSKMRAVSAKLTDRDIEALTIYVRGLRP